MTGMNIREERIFKEEQETRSLFNPIRENKNIRVRRKSDAWEGENTGKESLFQNLQVRDKLIGYWLSFALGFCR